MIRKILLIMLIMLGICISAYAVTTEYAQNIPVSFTFDVVANYGFTGRKVLGYVKPDGIDDVYFQLDRHNSTLKTTGFWMYYQIFTPENVKLVLDVGNFKNSKGADASDISFVSEDVYYDVERDSSVHFESGKQYTLLNKRSDSPYFDSFNMMFIIDDLSKIDWADEYTAVLTLTMVVG